MKKYRRSTDTPEVDVAGGVFESTEATVVDVAMASAAGNVSESREATGIDVAMASAGGDASESIEAMEVDVVMPSAPENVSESKAMMVDVVVPSAGGDISEPKEAMEVDVTMPLPPEIDVVVPSAVVDVPESKKTAEVDAAMPSVAGNVSEQTEVGDSNIALAGSDTSSKLEVCIHHFCPSSEDSSDADEATDSKLKPALFRAAAHAIGEAGNEGLSIPQLASLLARIGMNCTHFTFGGTSARQSPLMGDGWIH